MIVVNIKVSEENCIFSVSAVVFKDDLEIARYSLDSGSSSDFDFLLSVIKSEFCNE